MATTFQGPTELLDAVGTDLGSTDWVTVTQDMVNQFADATMDHQWIHVDVDRAKQGPFGAPIAHGFLTLSLTAHFLSQLSRVENISMGINYGMEKVRFPSAVPVGARLRGRGEVVDAKEVRGGVQVTIRVTIEREGSDKPAAVVDSVTRYLR
jgi:acyl dehydratase